MWRPSVSGKVVPLCGTGVRMIHSWMKDREKFMPNIAPQFATTNLAKKLAGINKTISILGLCVGVLGFSEKQ